MKRTATIVFALFCLCVSAFSAAAETAPQQQNHAYVPYEWCSVIASEKKMNERLDQLEQNGIDILLCDIGCYRVPSATSLSDTVAYKNLGAWIKLGHERGMTVLACLNYGITENANGPMNGTDGTYDDYIRAEMCRHAAAVTQIGVEYDGVLYMADGVHVDVEPFRAVYQEQVMALLRAVRATIGEEKMLSMASPAKNRLWSNAYATEIVELMDMVCPMLYDSCGPSSWGSLSDGVTRTRAQYIELVKRSCVWYAQVIAASDNPDCILVPTAPVYTDRMEKGTGGFPVAGSGENYYHLNYNEQTDETMEKLENCLLGVREAIAAGARVDGCGVFYWPSFIGQDNAYKTSRNPYYDPAADRAAWSALWLTPDAQEETTTTTDAAATDEAEEKEPVDILPLIVLAAGAVVGSAIALVARARQGDTTPCSDKETPIKEKDI